MIDAAERTTGVVPVTVSVHTYDLSGPGCPLRNVWMSVVDIEEAARQVSYEMTFSGS